MAIIPQPQKIERTAIPLKLEKSYRFCGILSENTNVLRSLQKIVTVEENAPHAVIFQRENAMQREEYLLRVEEDITVVSSCEEGAFRAVSTLRQIFGSDEAYQLTIHDYPDIPNRGVMIDISRGKIPKMEAFYTLIDMLSDMKYNQLQLYMDDLVFEYAHFAEDCKNRDALTVEELKQLETYCQERFIQLVPNQNGFGHMANWLENPERRPLGIIREDGKTPDTLNPLDERAFALVDTIYGDLLPHFSSDLVNIGMDETVSLGKGQTKELCDKVGTAQVYVDYLNRLLELTDKKYGKTAMFWDDIVFNHPEYLKKVYPNCVVMDWGYEVEMPYMERCRILREQGMRFYTCPGTSTWGSFTGRFKNVIYNLEAAAKACIIYQGDGFLLTDWGDGGNPQFIAISFLPYLYGACCSWSFHVPFAIKDYIHVSYDKQTNIVAACEQYIDRFLIGKEGIGRILHRMANYCQVENQDRFNGTYTKADVGAICSGREGFLDASSAKLVEIYMNRLAKELEQYPADTPYLDEIKCNCQMVILSARFIYAHKSGIADPTLACDIERLKKDFSALWSVHCREHGKEIFIGFLDNMIAFLNNGKERG